MLEFKSVSTEDEPFLLELYASTREEMNILNWEKHELNLFLSMQLQFQKKSYSAEFPQAIEKIIVVDRERVGRIIVDRSINAIHLIDICLLPEYRNHGWGTRLLTQLQAEARENNRSIQLSVISTNPAAQLYQRLGFVMTNNNGIYLRMEWKS